MFKGEKKRDSLWLFLTALVVVVMVLMLLAIPYAVIEAYGPEARKLILLMRLGVLAVFSGAMLIWWLVRYRKTGHDLEMLQEEIRQNKSLRKKPRKPRM